MKFFRIIRLSIWCVLLAACIAIVILNYTVSHITSDAKTLQKITGQAHTYTIVRHDIIAPRILAEAQDAGYGNLVDARLVQAAVDKSFSDSTLDTLLVPATESMANWLSSRQPDASFRIDVRRQLTTLTDLLATSIASKIADQPVCTYLNTTSDVATGLCRLSSVTGQDIRTGIVTALRAQPTIRDGVLSSDLITVPTSVVNQTRNIPEYLNMLNSAAIFAAGICVLSALWLLLKHRFRGIAVIGLAGLLAALVLFVAQGSLVTAVNSYVLEPGYQELARALASATATEMQTTLWPLVGVSTLLAVVGFAGWYIVRKQRTARHEKARVHFGESKSDIDNIDA